MARFVGFSRCVPGCVPGVLGRLGTAGTPREGSASWEHRKAWGISEFAATDFAERFPSADTGRKKRGRAGGHREARRGVGFHLRGVVLPTKNAG